MSEHTPGPWRVSKNNKLDVLASNNFQVARTNMGNFRGKEGREAFEYAKANARLIAAAPDGLDAAERAYLALLSLPASPFRAYHQHVYAMLRDYIAKATGRDAESVQDEFEAKARGEACEEPS